ncbi:beta-glucuronosyltransferase GlcAT14A isoform X2 [Arabidopsis lyrata subsp. lyrata]|uniref:beta-glucuronosyltransferase GlcAT14A isoform X2 n=1 Tax=Arabidopsis lyrata subsp. lyrata TaxID=81972 RepID=UPI000A29BE56|nr:beta-glucuronosyltransferase GlcAT14A isoform X2 [Arabidopsis lyrata subsp. lyrata]|eukprot:XP_020872950.1 beta-glucuronosyltransferase GlcAT14A isoform X2 [Arabidopsis lyrata subsp. lyrata]
MKKLRSYYSNVRHHQNHHHHHHHNNVVSSERKWIIFPLLIGSIFALFLLFLTTTLTSPTGIRFLPFTRPVLLTGSGSSAFVESKIKPQPISSLPSPPRFAYLISGSAGDGKSLRRTLLALYHPNNREGADWDWFINLSSSDYPLVTQDDLLHIFSHLPRDLNFIDHTSNIGWKASQRAKPVIIDPGLYLNKKSDVFWVTQRRSIPTAFKLFTGSAWMALSRPFIDYCIWGWDNLPRTVLMYYSNFLSSPEGYFHTVLCNAEEFRNTTVNSDLHFISWDNPPKQHPHHLTHADMTKMIDSNAPFARKFRREDPVLDKIDDDLLNRGPGMATPGGWCIGSYENGSDPCAVIGETDVIRPGPGARRLENLVTSLLSTENFRSKQCK